MYNIYFLLKTNSVSKNAGSEELESRKQDRLLTFPWKKISFYSVPIPGVKTEQNG